MPDIQHSALTGSELHEPKGIAGASSGQILIADGAGSGSWQAIPDNRVIGRVSYTPASSTTTTLSGSSVKIDGITAIDASGSNVSSGGSSNRIVVTATNDITVSFTGFVHAKSTSTTVIGDLQLVKNNLTIVDSVTNLTLSGATYTQISVSATDFVSTNDYYELWFNRTSGTDNLEIIDLTLTAIGV